MEIINNFQNKTGYYYCVYEDIEKILGKDNIIIFDDRKYIPDYDDLNHEQKYNYLHCDFPIINRQWFDRLGYVGSEFFRFWFLDTWICDLSFRSKQFLITDKIIIYQYSAHTIKEEVDDTHLWRFESLGPSMHICFCLLFIDYMS